MRRLLARGVEGVALYLLRRAFHIDPSLMTGEYPDPETERLSAVIDGQYDAGYSDGYADGIGTDDRA